MPYNLKSATPDASLPTDGFLFGADSQSATDPAIYQLAVVADTIAALRNPFVQITAQRTLANNTNLQALFDAGNDALTVEGGTTYMFRGLVRVANMSATSGNALVDILGDGTATLANILWRGTGLDSNTSATAANQSGSWHTTAASGSNIVAAAVGAVMVLDVQGIVRVNAAGTLIPSIQLGTAAAATVEVGTHMRFERMCANSVAAVGAWG